MTDIVDRLRRDATCSSHHEAADEIERLRAALRSISVGDSCIATASLPPQCWRAIQARSALKEGER